MTMKSVRVEWCFVPDGWMKACQLGGESGVDALTGRLPSLPLPPIAAALGVVFGWVREQPPSPAGWGGEVSIAFSDSLFS